MTTSRSGLSRYLSDLILHDGPISISTYMELALAHPEFGYYMTRDPLGRAGDFTTSPEISQMFGELLGLWCVDMWNKLGSPSRFTLAELGPGRGTLMADALRAAALVPAFGDAANVAFVEMSPTLKEEQQKNVPIATWYSRLDELPDTPLIVIANEFFDALPIKQFQRTEQGWCERHIGLAPENDPSGTPFRFGLTESLIANQMLPEALRAAPIGAIAEVCPLGEMIIGQLASRISANKGAAIIIDYGHVQSAPGDTLQAMKKHKFVDVLDTPGEADITAHVDFANLAAKAIGCSVSGPVEQGAFLTALGIDARAARLKAQATPDQADDVEASLRRLTDDDAMGKLFKVMALSSPGVPAPAGFY